MTVIPNGVDLEAFRPNPKARAAVRAEFGLPPETPLILMPARFHPQKDHRNFLAAAGRLLSRRPKVVFLLCGDGMDAGNAELRGWIEAAGVGEQVRLLGRRGDVARLSAGADLVTLSSAFGEAFPMVLLEAMACGTPCVATDVGDTACLLGETGIVVPPRNPAALADAWSTVLALPEESRRDWGHKARRRVEEQFDLSAIAERYAQLYREMRGA
jgi:glycosyltransferase involved in cell wall biosynthesis